MGTDAAEIRKSAPEDCDRLAALLSEEQRAEILGGFGFEPADGLRASCGASWCSLSVFLDGEITAMFGCRGAPGETGFPWVVTAPAIERMKIQFARRGREFIKICAARHGTLINWAREDAKILNWAKWCGFETQSAGRGYVRCVLRSR
jgi:hypothetical protein